jgi:Domain of unknown function (DUF4055)
MAQVTKLQVAAVLAATSAEGVAKPSRAYEVGAAKRALPRALMGGTTAMREAARTYLPQHPAESDGSYVLRLAGTTLYNGFAETVTSQAGKFYGEPVILGENVPPALVELCENIDGQGRALTPFMVDATKEGFVDGLSFILVDYPQVVEGATMADVRRAGARPYWILVTAAQLLGWRTENQNGQQVLAQVRISETDEEEDGEFGSKVVQRVRVLEPGRWRLYERREINAQGDKRWMLAEEGTTSLPYVPLVPVYINRTGYMEGAPPLRTLAELNQEHWISSSEQRRALSFARFAMLLLKGFGSAKDNPGIVVAPDKILYGSVDADAKYIEHGGAGIEAGRKDIEDIERRMQTAGMELRVENAGTVTATAAAIDSAETNAGLKAVAKGIEDSIEQALQITADIMRLPTGGEVEVNDDFGANVIAGNVSELSLLRSGGNISQPTLWEELKRRGVLDEDFDADKEQVLLAAEVEQQMEQQQAYFEQQQAAAQQQVDEQGNPLEGGA